MNRQCETLPPFEKTLIGKDMDLPFSDAKQRVFETYSRHVSSGKARFFLDVGIDFVFGRREGPFVWDMDGRRRLIN